jgi:endoglucanase
MSPCTVAHYLCRLTIAKSNPSALTERQLAFKRAKSLDNGISISWLEQTWSKDILKDSIITNADLCPAKNPWF